MAKQGNPRVKRTGERLQRNAYDLFEVANRLALAGYDREADGVRDAARKLDAIGRAFDATRGLGRARPQATIR